MKIKNSYEKLKICLLALKVPITGFRRQKHDYDYKIVLQVQTLSENPNIPNFNVFRRVCNFLKNRRSGPQEYIWVLNCYIQDLNPHELNTPNYSNHICLTVQISTSQILPYFTAQQSQKFLAKI